MQKRRKSFKLDLRLLATHYSKYYITFSSKIKYKKRKIERHFLYNDHFVVSKTIGLSIRIWYNKLMDKNLWIRCIYLCTFPNATKSLHKERPNGAPAIEQVRHWCLYWFGLEDEL